MFGPFWKTRAITLRLEYVVEEEDDGRFHAFAPALKGLHVDGGTKEEAERNLVAGIKVYLDSLEKCGDPLPIGPSLRVLPDESFEIPRGAFLGSLTVEWPSLQTSGIR